MKKSLIILAMSLGLANFSNAQNQKGIWSLEFNMGQNNAVRPYADGYAGHTSAASSGLLLNHFDVGARHMFSENFGAKVDLAYDLVKDSGKSLPFKTEFYRLGIQAVFNVGNVFKLQEVNKNFGLLLHGGPYIGGLKPESKSSEFIRGLMIGVNPQIKLSDKVSITADFTILTNRAQHYNWDGSEAEISNNLGGLMYNTSIGLTYSLIKHKKNEDGQNGK